MTELTINESAKLLNVSRRTFDKLQHRKDFPRPIKYSARMIRFLPDELLKWKLAQRG